MRLKIFWIGLSLVIIALAIRPLFTEYIPGTADGLAHKFRLVAFEKSLKEGNLRPRWLSDQALGFGSPIFLFNYSLPYYLIAGINSLNLDINRSTQIYEALTLVFSFLGMYLLGSRLWGRMAGVTAAALYILAPYHLMTVYLYEGWGEMTAFVFPPLILYLTISLIGPPSLSLRRINRIGQIRYFMGLVFAWFLFILSHNVSVLMFAPVLIFLSFLISRNTVHGTGPAARVSQTSARDACTLRACWDALSRVTRYHIFIILYAFVLAVLMSAFFWLPAVSLNKYTAYPELITKEMAIRGLYFKSLFMQIDNAISVIRRGNVNYYDFTVGLPILLIGLIGLISFSRGPFAKARSPLFGIFILGLFLSNNASNWLWDLFTPLNLVVYPFRFLFVATFAGALLAGSLAQKNIILAGVLIIFSVISGLSYTRPVVEIFPFPDSYFKQTQTVFAAPYTRKNTGTAEFLPKWADTDFLKKIEDDYLSGGYLPEKLVFSKGSGEISDLKIASEKISAGLLTKSPTELTVNTFYFPNWQAKLDGNSVLIRQDRNGRIVLDVPEGFHKLELFFGISGIEKMANIISIVGVILVLWRLLLFV